MSQSSLRVRYLLQRARRLKPSNVTEFARQVKKVSKAPLPVIVADMLWCSVRYEMGFRDYAVWDIRLLNGRERRTWMTHPKAIRLNNTLNGPDSAALLGDKPKFYRDFADMIGRDWLDVADADDDQITAFLARHPRVLVKPARGEGGRGITTFEAADITDPAAWRELLVSEDRTLVEELLPQHERMSQLYAGSVNTLRIITYRAPDERFHVIASVLRIGNGGVVDNFAGGGMFTMLDDRGVARWAGVDKNSNVFPRHPVTDVPIAGFEVPLFAEALAMVEAASRRLPTVPYVGWDVAITPTGPALIEANHNSSVFQMKPSVSGVRTGLLARYRDAVGSGVLDRR
ncbi:sugar-transfer associated ATP-grasp domain-containing protein [Microbacterium sp. ARD31]|uniref:sugar-transfer associated ATP-grasp domain-containing protein n=1 Tax=Microbacterium sp. ARD31 TaxID=2962576 RepID=UPI002881E24B|nr:sugar-transfer associated ATP-grasp domain-containing protein [Microbacterium sp. ARD31]MDT0181378.1 sugar-transfer associated ATP-grasp domain-containing protein [Microbacterium sp. ARD31]